MGKNSGAKQQVIDYRISLHLGVCLGPVDEIVEVRLGDKPLGITPVTTNSTQQINKPELFGGPKKGGGAVGTLHFLMGGAAQLLSAFLAGKMQRTPSTMTGYRGITSIFLTGEAAEGFTIGSNNPIVPNVDVTVSYWPKGLSDGKHKIGDDANPAHIIYEVMTDSVLGAGYDPSQVDLASFLSSSALFFEEEFGLSYQWMTSTPVESFVNEILATVGANLSFNLATTKWELLPLRGGYDTETLRVVYPGNAQLEDFQRKGWGETAGEMVVTWVNPTNEEEETVTVHDNANIVIQAGTVSDSSKNFPGIRNGGLALAVAERELRQASAPLCSAEVSVDRTFRNMKIGGLVKFQWPEKGVDEPIVMRVLKADYGKKGANRVKLSLIEDIFSFGVAKTEYQPPEWEDPDQDPIDPPHTFISSAPYYLAAAAAGEEAAKLLEFPNTRSLLLANTGLVDVRAIDVVSLEAIPAGGTAFVEAATISESGRFTLATALAAAVTSVIAAPPGGVRGLSVGGFLLLTSGSNEELCRVTALSTSTITVNRGVLDTIPRAWPSGTAVWAMNDESFVLDGTGRAAGDNVSYKFLPITSRGRLPEASATTRTKVLPARLQLPLRPANVRLKGLGIGQSISATVSETVAATWANRNRLTETNATLAWTAATTAPEASQTTTLRIYNASNTLITTIAGLTGTSRNITPAEFGSPTSGSVRFVEFVSVRDGLESFQSFRLQINFTS